MPHLAETKKIWQIKWAPYLKGRNFEIEKSYVPASGVLGLQMVLKNFDESYVYTIEVQTKVSDPSLEQGLFRLLNFLDGYLEEYVKDEDVSLPLDWMLFHGDQEEDDIYAKGEIRNMKLEKEADAFLLQHGWGESLAL